MSGTILESIKQLTKNLNEDYKGDYKGAFNDLIIEQGDIWYDVKKHSGDINFSVVRKDDIDWEDYISIDIHCYFDANSVDLDTDDFGRWGCSARDCFEVDEIEIDVNERGYAKGDPRMESRACELLHITPEELSALKDECAKIAIPQLEQYAAEDIVDYPEDFLRHWEYEPNDYWDDYPRSSFESLKEAKAETWNWEGYIEYKDMELVFDDNPDKRPGRVYVDVDFYLDWDEALEALAHITGRSIEELKEISDEEYYALCSKYYNELADHFYDEAYDLAYDDYRGHHNSKVTVHTHERDRYWGESLNEDLESNEDDEWEIEIDIPNWYYDIASMIDSEKEAWEEYIREFIDQDEELDDDDMEEVKKDFANEFLYQDGKDLERHLNNSVKIESRLEDLYISGTKRDLYDAIMEDKGDSYTSHTLSWLQDYVKEEEQKIKILTIPSLVKFDYYGNDRVDYDESFKKNHKGKELNEDVKKEIQIQNNENIERDNEELNPPIDLDYFPNNMGINLSSVKSEKWVEQDDGQLKKIEIEFDPTNNKEASEDLNESFSIVDVNGDPINMEKLTPEEIKVLKNFKNSSWNFFPGSFTKDGHLKYAVWYWDTKKQDGYYEGDFFNGEDRDLKTLKKDFVKFINKNRIHLDKASICVVGDEGEIYHPDVYTFKITQEPRKQIIESIVSQEDREDILAEVEKVLTDYYGKNGYYVCTDDKEITGKLDYVEAEEWEWRGKEGCDLRMSFTVDRYTTIDCQCALKEVGIDFSSMNKEECMNYIHSKEFLEKVDEVSYEHVDVSFDKYSYEEDREADRYDHEEQMWKARRDMED